MLNFTTDVDMHMKKIFSRASKYGIHTARAPATRISANIIYSWVSYSIHLFTHCHFPVITGSYKYFDNSHFYLIELTCINMLRRSVWPGFVLLFAAISQAKVVFSKELNEKGIVVMNMKDFPSDQIAMHMPCEESNMFATKCMVIWTCRMRFLYNSPKYLFLSMHVFYVYIVPYQVYNPKLRRCCWIVLQIFIKRLQIRLAAQNRKGPSGDLEAGPI